MIRSVFSVTSFMLLAACSQSSERSAPHDDGIETPSSAPSPAQVGTATPTPSTVPSPQPALSVRDLGLSTGVYAASGSTCPPAMASLATFDGSGFGSRNATQCSFAPTSRDGRSWSGVQTCTDSHSKARVTEGLTITVASASRFTRENKWGRATFDLCPDEKLTDWTG